MLTPLKMKILNFIIFFSILGTALRMGLEYISDFQSPINFAAIPQIVGCFLFGLTLDHDLTLSKGIQIGLAGSLTTFSGWIFSIFNDFVNFYSLDRSLGQSIYAGFLNILVTLLVAFSSFFFGMYSSTDRSYKIIRFMDDYFSNTVILYVTSMGLWILSLLFSVFISPVCYALVLAPLGSLTRYWITIKLNSFYDKIPLGTFLWNMIGTGILALCLVISYYLNDSCIPIKAITVGFCGNLTTLSSFINELLRLEHPRFYLLVSVITGLCIMLIIDGSFIFSLGLKSSDLSCFYSCIFIFQLHSM